MQARIVNVRQESVNERFIGSNPSEIPEWDSFAEREAGWRKAVTDWAAKPETSRHLPDRNLEGET
ncbi:MAG: hypothetical protein Fues2KO_17420 [Fuerstiella sp.]